MLTIGELFSKTFSALKGNWIQAICVFFVYNLVLGLVQAIPGIGGFLSLIISGPITVGVSLYCLKIINDNFPKSENILFGFKYNLGNGILAYFILIPIMLLVGFILLFIFLVINFLFYLLILSVYYTQSFESFMNINDMEALLTPFRVLSFEYGILEPILLIFFLVLSFCFSVILPWIIAYIPFAMTFFIMAEDTSIDAWDAIQKSWKMMKGYKLNYFMLNVVLLLILVPVIIFTVFIGLLWYIPFSYVVSGVFYEHIKKVESNRLNAN